MVTLPSRLLPQSLVNTLFTSTPRDLLAEPWGPLLLLVRVPKSASPDFVAPLTTWASQEKRPRTAAKNREATAEIPTVHAASSPNVQADYVQLLSELERAHHVIVPLPPRDTPIRIGRTTTNDLLLLDDSVSQLHAQLISRDGGVELMDLASKNGTWVGDERLTPQEPRWLQPMDRLQFGTVRAFTCLPGVLRAFIHHQSRLAR